MQPSGQTIPVGLKFFGGWADIKLVHPSVTRLGGGLCNNTSYSARIEPTRIHFAVFPEWHIVDTPIDNDMKDMNTLWTEFTCVALR